MYVHGVLVYIACNIDDSSQLNNSVNDFNENQCITLAAPDLDNKHSPDYMKDL